VLRFNVQLKKLIKSACLSHKSNKKTKERETKQKTHELNGHQNP